jgi:hypothetical protein
MLNRMNKHINSLSIASVQLLEKGEHGLKKKPSPAEMQSMETAEHGLKKKPTLRELLKMETKEHSKVEVEEPGETEDESENDSEENGKVQEPSYEGLGSLIVRSGRK